MGWTRNNAAVSLLLTMGDYKREVAKRLVQLMEEASITVDELAFKSGVTPKTISRLRNAKNEAQKETLEKIAHALNVPLDRLQPKPPAPLGLGETQLDQALELLAELRRDVQRLSDQVASLGLNQEALAQEAIRRFAAEMRRVAPPLDPPLQ